MATQLPPQNEWWVNDQTPDNPFGKSEDYEGFLNYLGDLDRSLTPEIAQAPLVINLTGLNAHPDYKEAAIGALTMWASVTPLTFTIVDDVPWDRATQWMRVITPEIGQRNDGSAYSSDRLVSVGQRFHDTEPNITDIGGYVFDTFVHEFGHEFGLNHPGLYNYGGPGGVQITYLNNATWIYDRQQYSVMSYFDGIDVGEFTRWSAVTPLMGDIEAVIRSYFSTVDENGVRTYQTINLNTGDDHYGFNSTKYGYALKDTGPQRDIGYVIHDTGGFDTIDFSGSTAATILDLRAGQFSSVNGHMNNVSIFAGHNADQTEYYVERGIGSRFGDVLIGNDGANILDGRAGADSMAGGGGDDLYFVDDAGDIVRETAGGGNDTIYVMRDGLNLRNVANVENIIYVGGSGTPPSGGSESTIPGAVSPPAEILTGTNASETIDGGAGGQTIFGRDGDDVLIGGRDTLASRDINNTIPIRELDDQTETDDGNDALYGGRGNDTLFGGAGDDTLDGGEGDDVFHGQAGEDVFLGGAGSDTVDFSKESPFQLIVNLRDNFANGGTASGDTFFSIENLIGSDDRIDRFIGGDEANKFWGQGGGDVFHGGGGNDYLNSGRDGDIVYGEAGNDTIEGGSEQDYLDGGAGIDTVVYAGSSEGVTVDLGRGFASGGDGTGPNQIVGRGMVIRNDILVGFENAEGSAHNDHLIGDDGANVLSGSLGNDTLTGGLGRDTLNGGAGSDTADYADADSGVRLNLTARRSMGDTYISIENLSGSGHNDRLDGDGMANVLTGQGGADLLMGRDGNDTLLGDFSPAGDAPPQPGLGTGYTTLGADATNASMETAFDLSDNFSLTEDPNIFDSTTVLHTTVNATGTGAGGWYKIELAAGTIISLDVDGIADPNIHDSWIRLVDAEGNIVAENDDGGGDPGSSHGRDSSLVHIVKETGTYYIVQGAWSEEGDEDGWLEAVPVGSQYTLNVSVDFPEPPAAPGEAARDTLNGGNGDDLLDGGAGADLLIGGQGFDSFRFSSELGGGNIDRIQDFRTSEDHILLDDAIFAGLGEGDWLSMDAFHSSRTGLAHDASDRIIYNAATGALWYDADGTGGDAAVQFATLSRNLPLTADHFILV